jgi:tetratricopeptide (TPR) repeat protein
MKACTRAIDSGKLTQEGAVKALITRASIHLHHWNRPGDAADDIDRAAAIAPDHLQVLEWRGIIALRLKSYGRALASFEAMLKRAPDHDSARLGRAHAMLGLKRFREALPEFDRAVKQRPEAGVFYMYRGQAYEGLGQRAAAIRDYRAAYRRSPNLAEARQALARMGEEP